VGNELKDPWERVRAELRESILSGELRPGERIFEVPLAERFELSRGPIREALRVLSTEGLIIREPRLGAMVVPIDERTVDEVYSLRASLEVFAVRRAFEKAVGDLALQLWVPLEQMRHALESDETSAILEADIAFHRALVEAAGHSRLLATWQGLVGPLQILLGLTAQRSSAEHRRSLLGHEQIYESIKERDLEGAIQSLTGHLELAQKMVLSYLRNAPT